MFAQYICYWDHAKCMSNNVECLSNIYDYGPFYTYPKTIELGFKKLFKDKKIWLSKKVSKFTPKFVHGIGSWPYPKALD